MDAARSRSCFLLNDPTRGVDVETKREIYVDAAQPRRGRQGHRPASSDTPELVHLCDRVAVVREGRIVADARRAASSSEEAYRRRRDGRRARAGGAPHDPGAGDRVASRAALLAGAAARAIAALRGLFAWSCCFLIAYAVLFPGLLSPTRLRQVHPELVPARARRDGAGDPDADRRHQPVDRRHRQPRRGDRGNHDGRTARRARRHRSPSPRPARRSASSTGLIVVQAAPAGHRRHARRLVHHRRRRRC